MADTEFTDETIRHRFFRDLVESERLKVFKAFGVYPEDCTERLDHSIERRLLNLILRREALASRLAEVDDEGLLVLPKMTDLGGDGNIIFRGYTAEQFRQGQLDAREYQRKVDEKIIARRNETIADLRFNIGELLKVAAPSHTTNKEK